MIITMCFFALNPGCLYLTSSFPASPSLLWQPEPVSRMRRTPQKLKSRLMVSDIIAPFAGPVRCRATLDCETSNKSAAFGEIERPIWALLIALCVSAHLIKWCDAATQSYTVNNVVCQQVSHCNTSFVTKWGHKVVINVYFTVKRCYVHKYISDGSHDYVRWSASKRCPVIGLRITTARFRQRLLKMYVIQNWLELNRNEKHCKKKKTALMQIYNLRKT